MKRPVIKKALKILVFALCPAAVWGQTHTSQPADAAHEASRADALRAGDSVVLGHFDNLSGDPVFDGTLYQALADELGASPFLTVLSDQKITEALRATGRSGTEGHLMSVSRQICVRDGGKAIVKGTISKRDGHYLIDLFALDCRNGNTLADVQSAVMTKKGVLQALRSSSTSLRAKLGEPLSSVRRYAIPTEATTSSLQALQDYSIAVRTQRENGGPSSIPLLKRAIELDPNFASAYALLSTIYGNLRQPALALRCAAKAYRLRNTVSEREKLRISSAYFLATGQLEREMQTYRLWQEEYPRDFLPYNDLGNDYAQTGNLVGALTEYQKGLELEPTQIGYVNVGGMYISLDRLAAAKATFNDALAHNLDGRYVRQNLYWLAFLQGNTEGMRQQLAWGLHSPHDADALLTLQSDTDAYHGEMRSARDETRRAVTAAIRSDSKEAAALWQVNGALREAEVGDFALAKREAASALALSSGRDVTLLAAFTLARSGASLQASALLRKVERVYPTDTLLKLYWLPTIQAALDLDAGDYARAISTLKAVAPYELGGGGTFVNYLYPAYVRGQAYLMAREPANAAREFQKLRSHPGLVLNFVTGALARLQLGRAYEIAGDTTEAKAAYQRFFVLWKDADPDVPVLQEARAEYASLR
jgi:eukaryotic-like serine/threonine-protein kinase